MNRNTLTKEDRKEAYRRQQRNNNIFFVGITVVVLSLAGLLIFKCFLQGSFTDSEQCH